MSENRNRDFSKYDAMETKDLENILRLDAESPEGEESDTELLLYVMEVLVSRRNNATSTGNNAFVAWESFQQNYLPPKCLECTSTKKTCRNTTLWLRRVIAAAAVIALIICVPITAKAFGWADLWNIFARWAKETFSFVSSEKIDISDPTPKHKDEFSSLEDLLAFNGHNSGIVPTWIPDGFVLEKIEKDITPIQEIYRAFYLNGDRELRIRVHTYLSDDIHNFEIDNSYLEKYVVSGVEYYIFDNLDQVQTVWIRDIYECTISGDLSIDEIKTMIDSIEKG